MAAKVHEPASREEMIALIERVTKTASEKQCTIEEACSKCGTTTVRYYYLRKLVNAMHAAEGTEAELPRLHQKDRKQGKAKSHAEQVAEAVAEANEEVAEYEAETVRVFVFEGSPEAVAEAIGRTFYGQ